MYTNGVVKLCMSKKISTNQEENKRKTRSSLDAALPPKHTQTYKINFVPTFSIYLLQLIQCIPSRFHVSSIPLFHLKQVQYVTILQNLKSPTGGGGERSMGEWFEIKGQVCRRKKRGVSDVSHPAPTPPGATST